MEEFLRLCLTLPASYSNSEFGESDRMLNIVRKLCSNSNAALADVEFLNDWSMNDLTTRSIRTRST